MFMRFVLIILISSFLFGFTAINPKEEKKNINKSSQEAETIDEEKAKKSKEQLQKMQGELDRLHNETWDDRYYKN
jgi:predicted transcriptional regulator